MNFTLGGIMFTNDLQAIRNNNGDVSAKDGSQETCVNLVASTVGMAVLTYTEKSGL